jgi:hypothetical protein
VKCPFSFFSSPRGPKLGTPWSPDGFEDLRENALAVMGRPNMNFTCTAVSGIASGAAVEKQKRLKPAPRRAAILALLL